jgi:hypothetical protein
MLHPRAQQRVGGRKGGRGLHTRTRTHAPNWQYTARIPRLPEEQINVRDRVRLVSVLSD